VFLTFRYLFPPLPRVVCRRSCFLVLLLLACVGVACTTGGSSKRRGAAHGRRREKTAVRQFCRSDTTHIFDGNITSCCSSLTKTSVTFDSVKGFCQIFLLETRSSIIPTECTHSFLLSYTHPHSHDHAHGFESAAEFAKARQARAGKEGMPLGAGPGGPTDSRFMQQGGMGMMGGGQPTGGMPTSQVSYLVVSFCVSLTC